MLGKLFLSEKTIFEVRFKFKEKSIYFIEIISAKNLFQNTKRKGERFPQTTLPYYSFCSFKPFFSGKNLRKNSRMDGFGTSSKQKSPWSVCFRFYLRFEL